jgi:hypothetical protein
MTPTPTSPTVSAIAPSSGPAAGGTAIRITGTNFAAGSSVTLGGAAATNVVVESATSITATTGAHGPGATDVTVTVSGLSGSLPAAFTYQAPASGPPVITAIAARGSRPNEPSNFADIGEEITVTATVQDPDTPADQLTYQWSATGGTLSGTGASVKWRAPAALNGSNAKLTVKLTLVVSDGTPVTGSADVSVHDSMKEIGDLARQFLLDFSDSNLKDPAYVVRNFSTSSRCIKERDSEYSDVQKNRDHYRIESSAIGSASVTVQFASQPCSFRPKTGDACATVPSLWNSLCLTTFSECTAGQRYTSDGTDYVAAVYEGTEWKLCSSDFKDKNGIYRPYFIR